MKVFFSHVNADKPRLTPLLRYLVRNDDLVEAFLDRPSELPAGPIDAIRDRIVGIRPGASFRDGLSSELRSSDVVLAVLSDRVLDGEVKRDILAEEIEFGLLREKLIVVYLTDGGANRKVEVLEAYGIGEVQAIDLDSAALGAGLELEGHQDVGAERASVALDVGRRIWEALEARQDVLGRASGFRRVMSAAVFCAISALAYFAVPADYNAERVSLASLPYAFSTGQIGSSDWTVERTSFAPPPVHLDAQRQLVDPCLPTSAARLDFDIKVPLQMRPGADSNVLVYCEDSLERPVPFYGECLGIDGPQLTPGAETQAATAPRISSDQLEVLLTVPGQHRFLTDRSDMTCTVQVVADGVIEMADPNTHSVASAGSATLAFFLFVFCGVVAAAIVGWTALAAFKAQRDGPNI